MPTASPWSSRARVTSVTDPLGAPEEDGKKKAAGPCWGGRLPGFTVPFQAMGGASGRTNLRLGNLAMTLTSFGTVHCSAPPPATPASPGIWLIPPSAPAIAGASSEAARLASRRSMVRSAHQYALRGLRTHEMPGSFCVPPPPFGGAGAVFRVKEPPFAERIELFAPLRGAPLRGVAHPRVRLDRDPDFSDHTDKDREVNVFVRACPGSTGCTR